MVKTWLITGSGSGLGSEIAKSALATGNYVIATARRPEQVCALESGGIRTNWGKRAAENVPDVLPEYAESVGRVLGMLDSYWGKENSDPRRIAELIVKLADEKDLPAHDAGTSILVIQDRSRTAAGESRLEASTRRATSLCAEAAKIDAG